jgi:hypothetical protein
MVMRRLRRVGHGGDGGDGRVAGMPEERQAERGLDRAQQRVGVGSWPWGVRGPATDRRVFGRPGPCRSRSARRGGSCRLGA